MSFTESLNLEQIEQENEGKNAPFKDFILRFWPTGFIGFGGPQAHVALMHSTFVDKELVDKNGNVLPHISEASFLELYALCQSLPGPGSTQLATALGANFGGILGALFTFFIFVLPGFIVMSGVGLWYNRNLNSSESIALIETINEYIVGLVAAAFAMVALSSFKIITKCCADNRVRYAICVFSAIVAVCIPPRFASYVFVSLLVFGGIVSLIEKLVKTIISQKKEGVEGEVENVLNVVDLEEDLETNIPRLLGILLIVTFLVTMAVALALSPSNLLLRVLDVFWTIGSIGFGGGVVVIPMLLNETVDKGLLPNSVFLAGFALIGCVPGPMFNLAAFLGAAISSWSGAALAWLGLFAPGIIIVLGVLPFWEIIRKKQWVREFVNGVNSAASGLILAGVYMVLKRTITGPAAFSLAISAGVAMTVFKVPSPIAIVVHGAVGAIFRLLKIGGPFS